MVSLGKNKIISDWILNSPVPLEVRINVINTAAFIELLSELGYRDGYWTEHEDAKLEKLLDLAKQHTINILKELNE